MNPFSNLVSLIAGSAAVLLFAAAGPVVYLWDRGAIPTPASIGPHLPFGIPCCWINLPVSQAVAIKAANDRSDQAEAAFTLERANVATLQRAFTIENASILSLKASSSKWQARSVAAVADAARANAWRLTLANHIAAEPEPIDQSELGLCRAADAVLKEGAQ